MRKAVIDDFMYVGVVLALLFSAISLSAQDIRITRQADRPFEEASMAKLEFVSNSDKLEFNENTGVEMSRSEMRNGKYVYSAVVDVADGGGLNFQIWQRGSVDKKELEVVLDERTWVTFDIEVTELPLVIQNIEITSPHMAHAQAETALVSVLCNEESLQVEVYAGQEKASNVTSDAPVAKGDGSFEFLQTVKLSGVSPDVEYVLHLSVGNSPEVKAFSIGQLAQKDGVEVAVSVVQESSCFRHNMSIAENYFINGLYREAYFAYKDALECEDKEEEEDIQKKIKNALILANAKTRVMEHIEKADGFRGEGRMDSCMSYYQDAYKYAAAILKMNANDSYCIRFNRDYASLRKELPRVVSGTVVDQGKIGLDKKNLPLANVHVVMYEHEVEMEKIKGVMVPQPGDVIRMETLAKTDATGRFEVFVPRNTSDRIYVLYFVFDESETGLKRVPEIKYIPNDKDIQRGLVVRFIAKNGINRN